MHIVVKGWPRAEWEPLLYDRTAIESTEFFGFLFNEVSVRFPEARIEFQAVSFKPALIQGCMKRMIPQKRKEQLSAAMIDRDAIEFTVYTSLMECVGRHLREAGDESVAHIFMQHCCEAMDHVVSAGIIHVNEQTEPYIGLIAQKYFENDEELPVVLRFVEQQRQW